MRKVLDWLKKHIVAIVSIITMCIISITSIVKCNNTVSASADYSGYPTAGYSSTIPSYTDKLLIYNSNNQLVVNGRYQPLDTYFTLMGGSNDCMFTLSVDTTQFKYSFYHNDNDYTHYYLLTLYFSSPNTNAPNEIRIGYGTYEDFGTALWGDSDNPSYFGFGYIAYFPQTVPITYDIANPTDKFYTFTLNYSGQIGLVCTGFDIKTTRTNGGPTTTINSDTVIYRYLTTEQNLEKGNYQDGYDNGYEQGFKDGYNNGYEKGSNAGYNNGYITGSQDGYEQGLKDGYDNGYEQGLKDGLQDNSAYVDGYEQGLRDAPNNPLSNIFGIVDGFMSLEILPNFSIKTLLLICLGAVGLVIIMKVFLGG